VTPIITSNYPLGGIDGEFNPTKKDGRTFILHEDFRIVIPEQGIDVTAPKEFVTDFNSVPRVLWVWFAPWECPEAGVIHDYLYQFPAGLTRKDVDDIHRKIMVFQGFRSTMARTVWWGIRAGGWKPWGVYRRRDSQVPIYRPTEAVLETETALQDGQKLGADESKPVDNPS
jgi:hypothetical protein